MPSKFRWQNCARRLRKIERELSECHAQLAERADPHARDIFLSVRTALMSVRTAAAETERRFRSGVKT